MPMHVASHLDMPIQATNHVNNVFLSNLGLSHHQDLSSTPTTDFIDVIEPMSASNLNTISLCLPSTIFNQPSPNEFNSITNPPIEEVNALVEATRHQVCPQ
uniref:Uncharacterized protein n=1 Tax=Salix viminalis TaxID=40686 RepID=A0A6N2KZ52_SALVM